MVSIVIRLMRWVLVGEVVRLAWRKYTSFLSREAVFSFYDIAAFISLIVKMQLTYSARAS